MLFALIDLFQYRLRRGPYGADQRDAMMGIMSHFGVVPQEVIDKLERGDHIYTQRLDSFWSWVIMYFASSSVDHVAIYMGDGQVLHMTLSGSKKHHLNAVARGARVLAIRPTLKTGQDSQPLEWPDGGKLYRGPRWFHIFPPKLQFVFGGLGLLTGYYPDRYKWQFLADTLIAAVAVDVPLWIYWHVVLALPIATIAVFFAAYRVMKFRFTRSTNRTYRLMSHPDLGLKSFYKFGGMVFAGYETYGVGKWGIAPMSFLAWLLAGARSGRECADNSPSEDLQQISKIVRDSFESGDFIFLSDIAKHEERQKNQDKEKDKHLNGPGHIGQELDSN